MSKKMLINATLPEEDRVAIVEDGILTELDIETAGRQQTKGNIYKAEVIRVEQGLQAAFVDYGAQRPGFLQIGEIHPSLYPKRDDDSNRRPTINEILKRGQQILVQVVKEERGTKGAALTTEISLPGRYMVLIPQSSSRGISRKIDNDQIRKGIKQVLAGLELPDNMGYIIRTAAIDQPAEELKRDFDYLLNTYNSIVSHSEKAKAPALIYQESNLVLRSIRDYFTPEIDEVLIDDREVFQQARDFFQAVMPDHTHLVKLHQERRPIFARYQIEEQISQLSSNTVTLPSGGSIVLDQTEALVAIDVNSGKMGGEQDVEATAHRVNMEAAIEVARQLRLRDMGGLIVIDFIDMRQRRNAREVEKALKTALKIDKARVTVGRISHQFGLLEMSRQRIKANLGEGSYHLCPHCQGSGRIRSEESRSIALLRRIQAGTAKGHIEAVTCTTALDTANYLLNNKRRELFDLEQRYKLTIEIKGDPLYLPEQLDIEFIKQTRDHQQTEKELGPLVDTDLSERANIEVVLPEPVPVEEVSQSEEHDSPVADEDGAKKSSRRRRRSNRRRSDRAKAEHSAATDEPSAAPDSETLDETQSTVPETPVPAAETSSPLAETATTPESATVAEEKASDPAGDSEEKPKRRSPRRRTSRKKPATTTDPAEHTVTAPPMEAATATENGTAPASSVPQPGAAPSEPGNPASAQLQPQPEETNATPPEDKKPAPRRRRAPRKTTPKPAEESRDNAAAKPETTAEPAAEKQAPQHQAAAKESSQAVPEAPLNATSEMATAAAPVEENKKPAPRRRRTTKKTAPEVQGPESASSEQASGKTAEDAPARKTPRRKPAAAKSAVDADGGTPQAAAEEADKVKKTPRRSSTTKSSAAKEDGDKSAPETQDAEAPKKSPAPKRRAPRKKAVAPAPASDQEA